MQEGKGRRLLVVLAHPDDETFGCGGVLARYAAEGVRVSLICATRGEAGEIRDPSLATRGNLAQVRERELRAACEVLGVEDLYVFGYRDSGMKGAPDNQHPEALCQARPSEVAGKIVEIIRSLGPQVVVTFDPTGGYGHPDHIAIHNAAVEAFGAAGDASRFPEQLGDGLEPHRRPASFTTRRSPVVWPGSFGTPSGPPASTPTLVTWTQSRWGCPMSRSPLWWTSVNTEDGRSRLHGATGPRSRETTPSPGSPGACERGS